MIFNANQLASYEQARALRDLLNQHKIGGGVLPGDDEQGVTLTPNLNFPWLPPVPERVGIYRPIWQAGPGGFSEPNAELHTLEGEIVKLLFLHFRFQNGKEGLNVGLILDKFRRYPHSQEYVLGEIAKEAQA